MPLPSALRPIAAAAIASLALAAATADAALIVSGSVGGAPAGRQYENFDGLTRGNATQDLGDITVSFTGDAAAVRGNRSGRYAAPFVSGNNGFVFGNADGPDTTTYLSTGIGTVGLQFDRLQRYFGLLWGSVDSYNSLEFYSGNTSVGTVGGRDVVAAPNGNQGVRGTLYVNIESTLGFDRVVARSGGYAFEFDNISYGNPPRRTVAPSNVPAPNAASFIGIGILATAVVARRAMRRGRRLRVQDNAR
jgi:hypothetical protein